MTLRSAPDLVATSSTPEQLELSRTEAARSSGFPSSITFVTTFLLAPGLIAAIVAAMMPCGGLACVALRSIRSGFPPRSD